MRNWLAVLAAAAFAPACYGSNAAFPCTDDTQCTDGADGVCQQSTKLCSYGDGVCGPAGRYGNNAGSLSGKCVEGSANGDIDAAVIDAPVVPPDAQTFCYGSPTSLVKVCLDAAPTAALTVDNVAMNIDTDGAMCATNVVSGGAGYCVVAKTDITVNATLRGSGSKPLVLIASGSITGTDVDAVIDVSSNRTSSKELGAGHDPTTCKPGAMAPKTKGGGAGGSFIGKGGNGGNGQNANDTGGTASDPVLANTVTTLRGGCGGDDGEGSTGTAGHGGGAIFLIANTKIDFPGTIVAGGEGGLGAAKNKGGGGGAGAGGMIGFDAPTIAVSNGVYANGGGGGEGISTGNNAGHDGEDALGIGPARGGTLGSTSGGDGGAGSSIATTGNGVTASAGDAGPNGNGGGGGGGGGGGTGIIKAPATANFGTKVSPLPMP